MNEGEREGEKGRREGEKKERERGLWRKKYKVTHFEEVNRYFQLCNHLIEFLKRKKKKDEEIWAEIAEIKDQKAEIHEDRIKALNDEELKEESKP